jgi:hypothetical protein
MTVCDEDHLEKPTNGADYFTGMRS